MLHNCSRKAGSGFRKSGAEYFLGKGIGLDAIVSSQEFRWLETKWKTKTDFWRGKEPSERLERIQGQKDAGRKGHYFLPWHPDTLRQHTLPQRK